MSEKTPVAVYNLYWKISEVVKNKSVITFSTINSQRIDRGQCTIYYLYDKDTDEIIGEESSDYFSIPSLNSSNISYYLNTSNFNIFDKVIIFAVPEGTIFDSETKKFIFSQRVIDTKDFLNRPVQITKLPDDPLKPDNVYYSIAVFEQ